MNDYFKCSRIKVLGSNSCLILPKKGNCSLLIEDKIGIIELKIALSSDIYKSKIEERSFVYKVIFVLRVKFKLNN